MFTLVAAIGGTGLSTAAEIVIAAAVDVVIAIISFSGAKLWKWLKNKAPKVEEKIEDLVNKDLDQDGTIGGNNEQNS